LFFGYKQLKPHYFYNNIYSNFVIYYSQRYTPRIYQSVNFNAYVQGQVKTLGYYYINANYRAKQHDYYEPRTDGYVFIRPANWLLGAYLSSNDAKKFSASVGLFHRTFVSNGSKSTEIDLGTQYRFNKKLSANISTTLNFNNKSLGYSTNINDSVIFALRRIRTVENIYTAKYNFTNRMGANIRVRHYWSKLANQNYFNLSTDGTLNSIRGISANADDNVNYFNVDFVYTWEFVSGSFFTVTWKNAIATDDNLIANNYSKNLHNTIYSNELNTVSLKVIYFLDYLSIKKKHH
jgi:hypothetical protein